MFVSRDREEELRQVARAIRARAAATGYELRDPTAIVFYRPLPYLYLARQVLTDARIPYQTFDAQPLAGEPYAALLDVVLVMARTGGTRESAVALLRSMILRIRDGDVEVAAADVAMLDAILAERRATGEADTYVAAVESYFNGRDTRGRLHRAAALCAARAATGARDQLHLAVRLAISEYLSRGGEAIPLLIDDCFATSDDSRARTGMRLLLEAVARRHQVLLVTCHRERYRAFAEQEPGLYDEHVRWLSLTREALA